MKLVTDNSTYTIDEMLEMVLESEVKPGSSLTASTQMESYLETIALNKNNGLDSLCTRIDNRNLENITFPPNVIGFRFFDLAKILLYIDGEEIQIVGDRCNQTAIIYLGTRFFNQNKSFIVCDNGYKVSNINDQDMTLEEFKKRYNFNFMLKASTKVLK